MTREGAEGLTRRENADLLEVTAGAVTMLKRKAEREA